VLEDFRVQEVKELSRENAILRDGREQRKRHALALLEALVQLPPSPTPTPCRNSERTTPRQ
jgi:hypothetical protein